MFSLLEPPNSAEATGESAVVAAEAELSVWQVDPERPEGDTTEEGKYHFSDSDTRVRKEETSSK